MGKEILTFGDIETEKKLILPQKTSIFLKDVDIEKVLVSKKISFGKKNPINTLLVTCIMITKLSHYM